MAISMSLGLDFLIFFPNSPPLPLPPPLPQVNDMVACLVRGSEGEDNWILAEVVSHNPTTNKYEVDDIDEEQKERHTLSRRRVYPLPLMRANPEVNPEALYPKGSIGVYLPCVWFHRACSLSSCGPVSLSVLIQLFFQTLHTPHRHRTLTWFVSHLFTSLHLSNIFPSPIVYCGLLVFQEVISFFSSSFSLSSSILLNNF